MLKKIDLDEIKSLLYKVYVVQDVMKGIDEFPDVYMKDIECLIDYLEGNIDELTK